MKMLKFALPVSLAAVFWAVAETWVDATPNPPPGTVELRRWTFHESPPTGPEGGEPTVVPDDWVVGRPEARVGWYRTEIEVDQHAQSAIYFPRVNSGLDVFLDGQPLRDDLTVQRPIDLKWYLPMYFPLPAGAERTSRHVLTFRLEPRTPGTGYTGPVYLGEAAALVPDYRRREALQIDIPRLIVAGMLLTAAFLGGVFFLRRSEDLFGWFGAGLFLWSWRYASLIDLHADFSGLSWAGPVAVGWMAICALPVLNRLIGRRMERLERRLVRAAAIGTIAMAVFYAVGWYRIPHVLFMLAAIGVGVYPAFLVGKHALLGRDPELRWLAVAGVLLLSCGAHDGLVIKDILGRDHGYLMHFASMPGVATFAWVFLRRFVRARETAEQLTHELEARVAQKGAELEANYAKLRVLEREQVLAAERDRLLLDMHDGIGGHLVSTLALVDAPEPSLGQVRSAVQAALDDLRLMLQSLNPEEADLDYALGMLRATLQPRLEAAGLRVVWQVQVGDAGLGPTEVLQVLRIVQEAMTNVLKHARAKTLSVRAQRSEGGVSIEVEDDGTGLGERKPTSRGLGHMQRRAGKIGGKLEITSGPTGGTTVRLRWKSV